jgi:hypothetical protein
MEDQSLPARGADAKMERVLLFLLVALGAYLRLWHLGSQIPLDDEWHAIGFALDQDFWSLASPHTRLGANSVPYNLYLWLAAQTVGLSELTIALPSSLAGILLLWYYPRWVRERFGVEAALVSAAVLALSPFLIFYSRFARPYAPLLLLEFLAIARLADWTRTGEGRHRSAAVAFGVLASWVHASAVAPLLAAWLAAGWVQWRSREPSPVPGPKPVAKAGLVLFVLAGSLTVYWYAVEILSISRGVLTGLGRSLSGHWEAGPTSPSPTAVAAYSWQTFGEWLALLSGSWSVAVRLLLAALALVGLVLAVRTTPRTMALLIAAASGALVVVLAFHPVNSESGAIFARYALPVFLLPALAIGVSGQALAERAGSPRFRRAVALAVPIGLAAALYLSSPLPRVLHAPNSFTKHPALLFDVGGRDLDRVRPDPFRLDSTAGMEHSELQPFYAHLAHEPGSAPVIEYPFLLGRNYNLLYFAQEIHHRPVLAGYYASGAQDEDKFGLAMGPRQPSSQVRDRGRHLTDAMMVDHVLGRGGPDRRVRFRTVVDILDEDAVARSGAEYLVLHGNLLREFFHGGPARMRSFFVGRILELLSTRYGPAVFDNDLLTVFRLPAPAGAHACFPPTPPVLRVPSASVVPLRDRVTRYLQPSHRAATMPRCAAQAAISRFWMAAAISSGKRSGVQAKVGMPRAVKAEALAPS